MEVGEAEVKDGEVKGAEAKAADSAEAQGPEAKAAEVKAAEARIVGIATAKAARAKGLPPRPAYGTRGDSVALWTNYVALDPERNLVFYRYIVDITKVKYQNAAGQLPAQLDAVTLDPSGSDATGSGGTKNASTTQNKGSGMKRAHIIAQLLDEWEELKAAHQEGKVASDYRDTLITMERLSDKSLMRVVTFCHATSDWRAEKYKVVLKEPEDTTNPLKMSDLLDYLGSSRPAKGFQKALYSQVLNIWLRQFSKSFQMADPSEQSVVGSKTYALDGRTKLSSNPETEKAKGDVGESVDAIRGYFSSIRFGAAKAWINVNVTYGAFFEPLALDKWVHKAKLRGNPNTLHTILKGVRVTLEHRKAPVNGVEKPITKVIFGLAGSQDGKPENNPEKKGQKPPQHPPRFGKRVPIHGATCRQVNFYHKTKGKYVSVYDYFCDAYPSRHIDPDELVINVGSQVRPVYYPISVCTIVAGQSFREKLSGSQTAAMIKLAQLKPLHSAQCITQDGFQVIGIGTQPKGSDPLFPHRPHTDALHPSCTLAPTKGRILGGPCVLYSSKRPIQVKNGGWILGDKERYLQCGLPAQWGMLPIERLKGLDEKWEQLVKQIDGDMDRRGFAQVKAGGLQRLLAPLPTKAASGNEFKELLGKKFKDLKADGYNFLFVLLPQPDTEQYNTVKTVGDIGTGIHTVCLVQDKVLDRLGGANKKPKDQYWDNILLKANLRLGGVNHTLQCAAAERILSQLRAMVVGYDVTHAAPGAGGTSSSIIGMVANLDHNLAQWPATISFQPEERKEIVATITCFQELLEPHLRRWAGANKAENKKRYPEALIIYRDGVSEGQYDHVVEKEYPKIRSVCEGIYKEAKQPVPKITIVIVGKRHHTRFYPQNDRAADRKGNPKPGTIVDRSITSQFLWEFYLQAHEAIQGTARPTHYVVVVDEFFGPTFGLQQNMPLTTPPYRNAADVLEDFTHTLSYCLGRATRSTAVCTPARLADKVCDRARCYTATGVKPDDKHVRIADALKDTMFYI
ncbi:ribonuclease H-like domain-containing protein [Achaetomium macrosporum]|uniref:Ribonuclease H-like domain-containing protein n=1 Tax=Achaetomium macrosporum TaxID=79813 RepID=A0AAN7HAK7_9PEZI|nr:ribonuclease H-like domain-containing protein [Achaetomium macrosporum]